MTPDPRFLRGIDHFNRAEYFEAHEAWEDLWIEVNDDRKMFFHGLVQAAVALHHARRGNFGGARSLEARMRNNLEMYRPACEGLDVNRFLAAMGAALAGLSSDPPSPPEAGRLPHISLQPPSST